MEQEEFQKRILTRIQKIESKTFDATFEENYIPRKQAQSITDDMIGEHHVGKKSKEALQ